jgi:hypothetical protein
LDRIRSLVGFARRRLLLEAWVTASLQAGVVTAAVLLALVVERRLLGASDALGVPSRSMGFLVAGASVAVLLAVAIGAWPAWRGRRTEGSIALEVDARLGTGERFSTAIALDAAGAADPFAQAAVADAVVLAADRDVASRARSAFELRAPQRWWVAPALLVLAVAAWFVLPDPAPLAGRTQPRADDVQQVAAKAPSPEEKRLEELVRRIEESPELAGKLQAELDAAKRSLAEDVSAKVRSADETAREAAKRTAELDARLAELRDSQQARAARDLQDALSKLELPEAKNGAAELAEAMKRGDFAAAKAALDKLDKALAEGTMSKEQREQAAAALDKMADQLKQMANDPSKLAEALKQAGMDPALANNPLALQQAIEAAKSLNATQKEALQKAAAAQAQAQQSMQQMAQGLQQQAGECRNPGQQGQQGQQSSQGQQSQQAQGAQQSPEGQQSGQGQQQQQQQAQGNGQQGQSGGDGKDSMQSMLSKAEADRQMDMAASAAQSESQSGAMSESEADSALRASAEEGSRAGDGQGEKSGTTGGRGQAQGGNREVRQTATGSKFQKQKGQKQEGDVIARQLVAGQAPVGESKVGLSEVAGAISPGYERGTEEDPVPAHLRDVHKRYFGDLRKRFEDRGVAPAKSADGGGASAAPAPGAPAPAAPAAEPKR